MQKNRNIFIIALIALVNMLGYGIIIPLLYTYSKKYGLSDFQNGLLFSLYSICQFVSTPIIGRLSDKYGRKPLLLISIAGTAVSFFITAFAPNAIFLFFLAFSCAIIYAYQPFTLKVLHINTFGNALLFTLFGFVGLISQTFIVGTYSKVLGMKKAFMSSLVCTAISLILMFLSHSIVVFVIASIFLGVFNSIVQTLIPTILSQETDERSQGSVMGLNASYQSIGMILGPIIGGVIATISIPLAFLAGSLLIIICYAISFQVLRPSIKKESAF